MIDYDTLLRLAARCVPGVLGVGETPHVNHLQYALAQVLMLYLGLDASTSGRIALTAVTETNGKITIDTDILADMCERCVARRVQN